MVFAFILSIPLLVVRAMCTIRAGINLSNLFKKCKIPRLRALEKALSEVVIRAPSADQCIIVSWSDSARDVALAIPCIYPPEEEVSQPGQDKGDQSSPEAQKAKDTSRNGKLAAFECESEQIIMCRLRQEFWAAQPFWKRVMPFLDIVDAREAVIRFEDAPPTIRNGVTKLAAHVTPIDVATASAILQVYIQDIKQEMDNAAISGRYAHLQGDTDATYNAIYQDSLNMVTAQSQLASLSFQSYLYALRDPLVNTCANLTKGIVSVVDGYPGLVYNLSTDSDYNGLERSILRHEGHSEFRSIHLKLGISPWKVGFWMYDLASNLIYILIVVHLVRPGWLLSKHQTFMTLWLIVQSGWRLALQWAWSFIKALWAARP